MGNAIAACRMGSTRSGECRPVRAVGFGSHGCNTSEDAWDCPREGQEGCLRRNLRGAHIERTSARSSHLIAGYRRAITREACILHAHYARER